MNASTISSEARIGHVHLRVADLDRAVAFYRDLLGFTLTVYGPDFGLQAAFLAAGGYHHHIALNTWISKDGTPPPRGHTGLHHVAIVYPDRQALARAVRRLLENGYPIDEAQDHGGTVSVYLRDPDGNGLELYYDLPQTAWYDAGGRLVMKADRIPVEQLLEEPAAYQNRSV
ncbi:VOC family protein [Larkinella soli]|uniref:VOC family protein n=1 Tax=Larkinella soli TaxID=1770527 RepID=UPI000FFC6796|nr:VOC family protein [Larkinella soli]